MARDQSDYRHNMRLVYVDVLAWSVMAGVGETYFVAFGLALGVGETLAGLLGTIPILAGSVIQLAGPAGVRRLGSLRRWVVLTCLVQAALYLPLAAVALHGRIAPALLFTLLALYWGAALASGPAWNTWVERLVPRRLRAPYFARRSRAAQVANGLALILSGLFLQTLTDRGLRLAAFAGLFGLAALARLVSAGLISRQTDIPLTPADEQPVSFAVLFRRARDGEDGRLLAYLLAATFAVHVSAPFFGPYLLAELRLPYDLWVLLVAAPFIAKILAMPLFGLVAARAGSGALLWFGGVSVATLPVLYVVNTSYPWLFALNVWAGLAWGAFDLASFLLFFEAIRREERTSILTTYNLARALVLTLGSLVGAGLLHGLGENRAAYFTIFSLGTALRFLALLLLARFAPARWPHRARPRHAAAAEASAPVTRRRAEPAGAGGS